MTSLQSSKLRVVKAGLFLTPIFYILFILPVNCNSQSNKGTAKELWQGADWIAYEQLADSMKVVPGVHGWGNRLGERSLGNVVTPLFRKNFPVKPGVEKVSLHISGLGHYEATVNGAKVGDSFLAPGWTLYEKRQLFNSYDITDLISKGENILGVMVGGGFFNINRKRYRKMVIAYGNPRLIFHIQVHYKDGSHENIWSDSSCKVTPSPITFSSIYGGEDYDARREITGWEHADFDDSDWNNPVIVNDSVQNLVMEQDRPLKVMEVLDTIRVIRSETGRQIYDFGQNGSGIIGLKVKGNRGTTITIRPDEILDEGNNITQRSGGGPYEFNYTLKGGGVEEWRPRFTYYGFRYVEVEIIEAEGVDSATEIIELNMLHTRNSAPEAGSFSCSDTSMNQIYSIINRSIKSNMASVLTDCPHREKLGWLEQSYLMGPSINYNFDMHALSRKIVNDMIDSQLENGLVPDIAPEYVEFRDGFRDSPEWGSAAVLLPWQIYRWYGDTEILELAYPMMQKYMIYLEGMSENNILVHGLGDWYDLGPDKPGEAQLTPKAVTATAICYLDLKTMEKIAGLLNLPEDAARYSARAAKVRNAFLAHFYNKETGVCSTGSQTAYAISLYTKILPEEDQRLVIKNMVSAIEKNDYALTSGDVGYFFLVRVLRENGLSELLFRMNNRSDRPGYAWQIEKGATTLSESWAALPSSSQNHIMLGHLMEWFYSGLGGIYQDDNSVAFSNIVIAPNMVGDIGWVKCTYQSVRGEIVSEWEVTDDIYRHHIVVPENSSATVKLPGDFLHSDIELTDLTNNIKTKVNGGIGKLMPGDYMLVCIRHP
ncbi:MAG: family 78 glycoside hydrolase catalytic domain [Bacteroidales bacterium]